MWWGYPYSLIFLSYEDPEERQFGDTSLIKNISTKRGSGLHFMKLSKNT